jgi:hypothetical protein
MKKIFLSNAELAAIHSISPEHLKFSIVNAMLYILQARSAWRPLPDDFLAQMRLSD